MPSQRRLDKTRNDSIYRRTPPDAKLGQTAAGCNGTDNQLEKV
jgi:hypothetical protein